MIPALFTSDQWLRVGELFDHLSILPADERNVRDLDEPDAVREMLDRMLAAHDSEDPKLLDQTLGALAGGLLGFEAAVQADYRDRVFGPWRALEEIGRGGMAVVLRGERADGQFEKEVAIKLLPAGGYRSARERLLEEIRILARLEHPGIARLIDGGISDTGLPYLVMEYVQGVPITEHCQRHALNRQARIELFEQVVVAVQYAHQHLVVHCDIKPGNILVTETGQVRLVDFGIADLISNAPGAGSSLRGLFCSPGYAAPEQLRGQPPSVSQDIYSLGTLLYELLSDRRLRNNRSATRLLFSRSADDEGSLPSDAFGDRDLEAIVRKALAPDPSRRYPTANALAVDLVGWRRQLPVSARNGGIAYRTGRWLKRHRLPALAGSFALLALLTGTTVALWQAERARMEAEQARHEAVRATAVKDFLLSLFRAGDPLTAGGAELDTRAVLARGAERMREDDQLPLDVRIEILNTLADVQRTLDWNEEALISLQQALELADSVDHPPAMAHAETLYQRGTFAANVSGELDTAIEWYGRALAQVPALPERDSRWMLARTLISRGGVYARLSRLDESESDLAAAERLLDGLDPPDLELAMLLASSQGVGAYSAGHYPQAYHYLNTTAELQRQLGNEQTGSMVMTLANLGAVASVLGLLDEALGYDREAVRIARQAYADGHHQIGWSLYALGDTLRQMGHFEEAEQHLMEARQIFAAAGHEDDPRIESVDLVLARLLLARGQPQSALELAARLRPAIERRYGPATAEVLRLLQVEIEAAAQAGLDDEFEQATARAASRLTEVPSSQQWSPVTQQVRWVLADSALDRGDSTTAWYWFAQARNAPSDAPGHASVEMLLAALELRLELLVAAQPPSDRINRLTNLMANSPTASSDALVYAWLTIARAHQAVDPDAARQALTTAQAIASRQQPAANLMEELTAMLPQ